MVPPKHFSLFLQLSLFLLLSLFFHAVALHAVEKSIVPKDKPCYNRLGFIEVTS